MTIQEMSDVHVGHPEEIDEDVIITAQRESYKWGALAVLKEIEDTIEYAVPNHVVEICLRNKIKELRGQY